MRGGNGEVKQQPYWGDTVVACAATPAPLPASADVVVIGAGITGLSAARALARRGLSVVVLEAHTLGWGASSRNGGMVLTGLKLSAGTLLARYGRELGRQLYQASLDSVDLVEQLIRAEGIDCSFRRSGHLALASKGAHYEHFARAADLLARKFSHPVRLVPRGALRNEIGSGIYHGAMVDELSGGLNPAQYVAGLVRAARSAGALLHERTLVERIERLGPRRRVRTARGTIDAAEILVASSGYTGAATPALRNRLLPIGSYIIVTEPLTEALAQELSPRGRMMYDSRHFLHYFRLTADRRLLFGGRARFVPETGRAVLESAAVLRRGMLTVYPQLHDTRVDYAWGGTLDFTFDTMPHLGSMDGYHYALGYAGHGVALATYLGTRFGERLGTTALPLDPFTQIPFPGAPLGLHVGKSWLLRCAAAWYKILDCIQ